MLVLGIQLGQQLPRRELLLPKLPKERSLPLQVLCWIFHAIPSSDSKWFCWFSSLCYSLPSSPTITVELPIVVVVVLVVRATVAIDIQAIE